MSDQLEFPTYAREIIDVPVAEELSESFLAYSLSVITSRAIPDVRDGLKPVQRRILWSMLQMGIRPDTPYRKSARIVGDTMGQYHPHGDAAIYDTLARMAQDFARMIPFIDPQGNFGSLDDPPAAARYTECRMSYAAMDMVRELDEDTVDSGRPTPVSRRTDGAPGRVAEPTRQRHQRHRGRHGHEHGPHNLREIEAVVKLVMTKRRPKPTIDELMVELPGPDFPSGGIVSTTGCARPTKPTGIVPHPGAAHVEQITRGRQAIVVTELPYLVGPERVMAKLRSWSLPVDWPGCRGSPTSPTCTVCGCRSMSSRVPTRRRSFRSSTDTRPSRRRSASITWCWSTECPPPSVSTTSAGTTSTTASR